MLNCWLSNAARCLRFCAVIVSVLAGTAHAAPFAYINNQNGGNISVIDAATKTVVAAIAVRREAARHRH